jgi:hypothetical protein
MWKLAIHVPESWVGCEILWVSPLAYHNLFGTKGFCFCCCWSYWINLFNSMILMSIPKVYLYPHGIRTLNPTHGHQGIPMGIHTYKLNKNISP